MDRVARQLWLVPLVAWSAVVLAEVPKSDGRPAGVITGTVRFTGAVPAAQMVVTDSGTIEHRDLVVDPTTMGLKDVVAVLEDAPAQPRAERAEPVVVDQKNMVFLPRVIAVQHGRAVRFDNSDNFNHSVMSASTTPENNFNVFVLQGKPLDHLFVPQKHPVQIGCSLHPWMRAWVYVLPHPWFAVSDTKGRFKIDGVPPGKFTLWLRHADSGLQERKKIEVEGGKTVDVTVTWTKVSG